jgi:hypothetical protein
LMGHELVLLASDRRLLRAAEKEDLAGLNPEEAKTAGVEVFLRPQESGI